LELRNNVVKQIVHKRREGSNKKALALERNENAKE